MTTLFLVLVTTCVLQTAYSMHVNIRDPVARDAAFEEVHSRVKRQQILGKSYLCETDSRMLFVTARCTQWTQEYTCLFEIVNVKTYVVFISKHVKHVTVAIQTLQASRHFKRA